MATRRIEQRLRAAAAAAHEFERLDDRAVELRLQLRELTADLADAREQAAARQREIDGLTGFSIGRLTAAVRGDRADRVAHARAAADLAEQRAGELQARIDLVRRDHDQLCARLDQVAEAPATYTRLLAQWEQIVRESDAPAGQQLRELAARHRQLAAALDRITAAQRVGAGAAAALDELGERLDRYAGWQAVGTVAGGSGSRGGGGLIAARRKEAVAAARAAEGRLTVLREEVEALPPAIVDAAASGDVSRVVTQLSGLRWDGFAAAGIDLSPTDLSWEGSFTDLIVPGRVRQAQRDLDQAKVVVAQARDLLAGREGALRARLAESDSRRRELIEGTLGEPPAA